MSLVIYNKGRRNFVAASDLILTPGKHVIADKHAETVKNLIKRYPLEIEEAGVEAKAAAAEVASKDATIAELTEKVGKLQRMLASNDQSTLVAELQSKVAALEEKLTSPPPVAPAQKPKAGK